MCIVDNLFDFQKSYITSIIDRTSKLRYDKYAISGIEQIPKITWKRMIATN